MRSVLAGLLVLLAALPAAGQGIVRPCRMDGADCSALPAQATHSGKYLYTNGLTASWEAVVAGVSGSGAAGRLALWSSASGLTSDSGLTYSGTGAGTVLRIGSTGTGLSEISAGVIGVGTGAAGSVAGTVSAAQLTLGTDAFATRRAAATLQLGAADSATPVAQTLAFQGSRGGTDTNVAGADTTIQGSLGTGTAASGKLVFKVGTPQATGTTQHVPATVLELRNTGTSGTAAPQAVLPGGTLANPSLVIGGGGLYDSGNGTIATTFQLAVSDSAYVAGTILALSNLSGAGHLIWYGGGGIGYDAGLRRYGVNQLLVTNASTGTGGLLARYHGAEITSDAVIQVGQVVMPDAGTDGRFDINTGSATTAIGVLTGTGPAAQGTGYGVAVSGVAYVCPATGQNVTRGHFLVQSATAGVVDDSATIGAAGLTIAKSLYSEAADVLVSATATTDVIVLTSAPGWAVGDPVVYYEAGGAAIAGLTTGTVYWIKTISSADVTLSATRGGAVVDITVDGTISTQYLQRLPQAVVNIQ